MKRLICLLVACSIISGPAQAGLARKAAKKAVVVTAIIGGAGLYAAAMQKRAGRGGGQPGVLADSPEGYERPLLGDRVADAGEKAKDKIDDWVLKSDTRKLRSNLAKAGEQGGKNCDAHHIVPKNDNREWAKDSVSFSRGVLESCGIDLDSAANGVWLPGKENDSDCVGTYHKTIHTKQYYVLIRSLLSAVVDNGCESVSEELHSIKQGILRGEFL